MSFTLDEVLVQDNPDYIPRTKWKKGMKKCCNHVHPKNGCSYVPCCICVNNERIRNGEPMLNDTQMESIQCRIQYVGVIE